MAVRKRKPPVGEEATRPANEIAPAEVRAELLSLAKQIVDHSTRLTEEAHADLVDRWSELCPHPGQSDIIFWPNELGLCTAENISSFQMTPEEMVDFAMNWEPRVVAMQITQRSGSERVGYYIYTLEAPETPKTQVATSLQTEFRKGDIVAVALRGMRLKDGTRVTTEYPFKVHSCGRILDSTGEPAGTRIFHHPAVIESSHSP
jgi:hypothetical protein